MSIVTTTEDLSGYKLFARSLQSKHFKTIFETLKELLIDTNIQWDKDGLKIIDLDNTRVVMIHLRIHADKFEDYVCEEPITMGVNLTNLNKLMKPSDNSDTHFLPGELDMNRLAIKVENSEKRTHTVYKLNMLEIEQSHLDIRKMNVQTCVHPLQFEFSAIVRRCPHCRTCEIQYTDEKLILKRIGTPSARRPSSASNVHKTRTSPIPKSYRGVFSLKYSASSASVNLSARIWSFT
jgi:proliferating cell nuclear antigen PCNA